MPESPNDKAVKKREETPEEYKWRLDHIYASLDNWEKDFQKVKKMLPVLASFRGRLHESPQMLRSCLDLNSDAGRLVEKIYVFARMHRDEDNTVDRYQALTDRAQVLSVEAGAVTSYIVPEILRIPADALQRFLEQDKGLEIYRHYLDEIIRMRDHVLSEPEEEILAQAGDVTGASGNIFTMFNNADLRFPEIRDSEGNILEVTHGKYLQLMESRDQTVRRNAFNAVYHTYQKWLNTVAATLSSAVKRDNFYAKVRKYPSALIAALDEDNVIPDVYDNLISTVKENLEFMYRYIRLRRKMLQLPDLHMYDLYVPLIAEYEQEVPYEEAAEIVKNGLQPLGQEYRGILARGFAEGWIDVFENIGKTSGAYSWGSYDTHPYVLLNYRPNLHNVFTIAHEMGHALHSYYSNKNQPYIYAGYRIFVAEVASTVNEVLLIDYLIKKSQSPKERMYLINYYLEQFRGTIYRQTMFAEFEKIIHAHAEQGEALTPEIFKKTYYGLNKVYYGEDIILDDEIAVEWARIPHFYHGFYVYKYATGFSAAVALAQRILDGEPGAVEAYISFLSSGSKDYPLELLREAGVDMTSPEPIQKALNVFADLVRELESLAG
ncbi:MAG: oligoendopeptidase F [Bacillota bacterium]